VIWLRTNKCTLCWINDTESLAKVIASFVAYSCVLSTPVSFIYFHQQQLCWGLHISFRLHFGLVRAPLSDVCYTEWNLSKCDSSVVLSIWWTTTYPSRTIYLLCVLCSTGTYWFVINCIESLGPSIYFIL
jgi:hypothetical protein